MHVTPEQCAAVYDCLREFPPFKAMKLIPADEVEFKVTHDRTRQGYCSINVNRKGGHIIGISSWWIGEFLTLVQIMAHEMIHMDQWLKRTDTRTMHNRNFRKIARAVCQAFQWDYRQFVTT